MINPDQAKQICQLVARLADVVEALALQYQADQFELTKLRNIRQDTLILLDSVGRRVPFGG